MVIRAMPNYTRRKSYWYTIVDTPCRKASRVPLYYYSCTGTYESVLYSGVQNTWYVTHVL